MRDGMTPKLSRRPTGPQPLTTTHGTLGRCLVSFFLSLLMLLLTGANARAEEIHPEAFAGTVASRTDGEVGLSLQPDMEFGREEELWVYQKRDVIHVGGVVVKITWARVGKIQVSSLDGNSAEAVILEEFGDSAISVGDEVGKLPNTRPKIVSLLADSQKVKPGHEVGIYVEAADDEGNTLHYSTEATGGTLLHLSDASSVMQWVAPEQTGTYEISIRVDDGKGGSVRAEVPMEVSPVAETDPYALAFVVGGNSKAAWQFGEVTDVEIDDRDNMWVLDAKSNLIRRISPAGVRLGAIDLTHGGSGFGVSPSKIRLGDEGVVHVLDISHETLDRLDTKNSFVETVFDDSNRKDFLLEKPSDVEVTPAGDTLVTDSAEGHVAAIDDAGRFVLLFGPQGTGRGQLDSPVSITTNRFGDMYVLDSGKEEILAFDRTFRFRAAYPCPMEDESGEIVAYDRGNSVFVLDSEAGSVRKLEGDGTLQPHVDSIKGKDSSGPVATSMAVGSDGRILIGTANASIWEFDPTGALRGILGEENFGNVPSIAATDEGNLFVLDGSLAQVKRFDRHGWLRGRFGEKGKYEGQFQKPERIGVDGEGNCYIFDSGTNCIQRFTGTGAFDKLLSAGEDVAGNLNDAVDIAIQKDGSIYILDDRRKAVFILSRDGELKKIVPLTASDARSGSEIRRPAHVAVDGQGTIYVSDPSQYVVYKFDAEGKRVQTLGGKGREPGEFGKVGDLAADRLGFVYVLLTDRGTVAKFDGNGRFLMEIALKAGKDEPLKDPEVIAVDSLGSLYVYDDYYNAVFKFMQ